MRCRNMVNGNVVWFGSYGKNSDGTKISADNFASEQNGVAADLTQRLNILKKELWYDINYGLPLLEKINSKFQLDAHVSNTILKNKDVKSITSFESKIINHNYTCSVELLSVYGEMNLII